MDRQKSPLKPGRGLLDWIRLCQGNDLSGRNSAQPLRVTELDMVQHNCQSDAWMVINGKVYNVTAYMEYHPGGVEQLLRAAGTDGTKLFNEKHPWVNYESMLKSCFVGHFVGTYSKLPATTELKPLPEPPATAVVVDGGRVSPGRNSPKASKPVNGQQLKCTWTDEDDIVQMLIETGWKELRTEKVVVECCYKRKLRVLFRTCSPPMEVVWALPFEVNPVSMKASISAVTKGCLSVSLQKDRPGLIWPEFIQNYTVYTSDTERKYRTCTVQNIENDTHDVRLLTLDLPYGNSYPVPIGNHVFVRATLNGSVIERPYTPVIASLNLPPNGVSSAFLHLLFKTYPDGAVSKYLWSLKKGDTLDISDHYGDFNIESFRDKSQIYILAAGSGFTPMVKIMQYCLHAIEAKVTLLFFNKTEEDIIWRDQLDKLAARFEQFHLINILSETCQSQSACRSGRVSTELLAEFVGQAKPEKFVCICGPPGFVEHSLTCLQTLHYDDDFIHVFHG